jgi:hypothetical protein
MALWESPDEGKNWKRVRHLTKNSPKNHSYARRPLNANEEFYSFWADGDADKFSESRVYFTNQKGNKVWVLPFDMWSDFATPLRVK